MRTVQLTDLCVFQSPIYKLNTELEITPNFEKTPMRYYAGTCIQCQYSLQRISRSKKKLSSIFVNILNNQTYLFI